MGFLNYSAPLLKDDASSIPSCDLSIKLLLISSTIGDVNLWLVHSIPCSTEGCHIFDLHKCNSVICKFHGISMNYSGMVHDALAVLSILYTTI